MSRLGKNKIILFYLIYQIDWILKIGDTVYLINLNYFIDLIRYIITLLSVFTLFISYIVITILNKKMRSKGSIFVLILTLNYLFTTIKIT